LRCTLVFSSCVLVGFTLWANLSGTFPKILCFCYLQKINGFSCEGNRVSFSVFRHWSAFFRPRASRTRNRCFWTKLLFVPPCGLCVLGIVAIRIPLFDCLGNCSGGKLRPFHVPGLQLRGLQAGLELLPPVLTSIS